MPESDTRQIETPSPNLPAARASVILVAAGSGQRMGGVAKVLLPLNGRPVITYALDAIQASTLIEQIVLVGSVETLTVLEELLNAGAWTKLNRLVLGGERRQDSVEAGLAAIDPLSDVVAVHDGARPFAPTALFDACVIAARAHGAAIAASRVVDTLKRAERGVVHATVERSGLWSAQTPQAARVGLLIEGFAVAHRDGLDVNDEAMLMEAIGQIVCIVPSDRFNIKITHPADLPIAEAFARYLEEKS